VSLQCARAIGETTVRMETGKIVLIVGSFAPSLIIFRGPLIRAMIECGHSVIAAAPNMDEATAGALRELGATPRELPLSNASLNPLRLLDSVGALRALIREERPDVVLAYTIKPVIAGALAGRAERVATTVALITGAGYAFTGGREVKRLVSRVAASLLYRIALKRTDVIIFQNPDDERLFRRLRLVPSGRATHIVNGSGVDLTHFSPAPLPQRLSFLMIARLLKDKGIREFAEAAKRLKAAHPEVPITLVGGFDPSPDSLSRQELDELIRCGIDYRGHLADVRPAIAACTVYVLPSYREGTPRSVLEAMAMGRAVITTDAAGCRETVIEGENGFLVRPREADSLYRGMMRFVDEPDLAERMGAASRRLAEARFDVRQVNQKLLRYAGLSC
jgi:glycosyltransferase involved in cell wall biosynthesis